MWSPFIGFVIFNVISTVTSESTTRIPNSFNNHTTEDNEVYFGEIRLANTSTQARAVTFPCQCANSQCGCCSGNILQNFNINMRQRVCMNTTYEADDFTFGMKLSFNDKVFYNNKVSAKNPPPACVPIPRITAIKICVRLTNVYFIGRNVHACVVLETQWNKETAFAMNFDCIRLGADGVSVVKPEDAGGLPQPLPPDTDVIEEYDELIENQPNNSVKIKPNKTKITKTRNIKVITL